MASGDRTRTGMDRMESQTDSTSRQDMEEAPAEGVGEHNAAAQNTGSASDLLKAMANENRLIILCLLADGEKSVTQLEIGLDLRQPAVSQQLARLRADKLVSSRRDGKSILYSLASDEARRIIEMLCGQIRPRGDVKGHPAADKVGEKAAE